MTKRIAHILLFAAMMVLMTAGALAQDTTVKGTCKDEAGKVIAGGTIELLNLENGQKVNLKTNSNGEYFSMGIRGGNYKLTLYGPDGKMLYYLNNAPLKLGEDNVYDFDLEKIARQGMTDEQRQAREKVLKANEKIKSLNAMLQQAAAQKKEGKYDDAVATMEQAAALDQTHDIIYGSLADAYLLDKKYPEAEKAFNKALELAPSTSKSLGNYHIGLALSLLRQNKNEAGMAECGKAGQATPTLAGQCFYNAGAILTNQGKLADADQAFDKAIAADPTRADAYYQKGVNLLSKATIGKDGKMIPAPGTAEALNKYLELAPDGKNAQACKALLASIGASVQTSYGTKKSRR